jgi:hypothetical protein
MNTETQPTSKLIKDATIEEVLHFASKYDGYFCNEHINKLTDKQLGQMINCCQRIIELRHINK